jgi:hypothetical protein
MGAATMAYSGKSEGHAAHRIWPSIPKRDPAEISFWCKSSFLIGAVSSRFEFSADSSPMPIPAVWNGNADVTRQMSFSLGLRESRCMTTLSAFGNRVA